MDHQDLKKTILASTVAGSISKFLVHPIDTIKAKLQVNRTRLDKIQDFNKGLLQQLIRKTYREQGIPGFYRGVTISCLGSAFAFSAYMTSYEWFKHFLESRYQVRHSFLQKSKLTTSSQASWQSSSPAPCGFPSMLSRSACRSRANSIYIATSLPPRQPARSKIQRGSGVCTGYLCSNNNSSIILLLTNLNVQAFGATLMFFGPYSALMFMFYENLKKMLCQDPKAPQTGQNIIACSGAASLAGILTNPLDIAKLRMQIQRADKAHKIATQGVAANTDKSIFGYRNMFHGIYLIATTEGYLALFRGSMVRIAFTVPSTTVSMVLTEEFKQMMKSYRYNTH